MAPFLIHVLGEYFEQEIQFLQSLYHFSPKKKLLTREKRITSNSEGAKTFHVQISDEQYLSLSFLVIKLLKTFDPMDTI